MAGRALLRRAGEDAAQVALLAAQIQMLAVERKAGRLVVEMGVVGLRRACRAWDRTEQHQSKCQCGQAKRLRASYRSRELTATHSHSVRNYPLVQSNPQERVADRTLAWAKRTARAGNLREATSS